MSKGLLKTYKELNGFTKEFFAVEINKSLTHRKFEEIVVEIQSK